MTVQSMESTQDDLLRRFPQLAELSADVDQHDNRDAAQDDDAADRRDARRIEAFRAILGLLRKELDDIR